MAFCSEGSFHTAYDWSAWQIYWPLSQSSGYCFMYTYLYIFITISFNVCSASVTFLFKANWNIFEIITISTRDQEGSVTYWHSYEISSVHMRWRLILDCRKSTRALKTVWKNVTRWKIVNLNHDFSHVFLDYFNTRFFFLACKPARGFHSNHTHFQGSHSFLA